MWLNSGAKPVWFQRATLRIKCLPGSLAPVRRQLFKGCLIACSCFPGANPIVVKENLLVLSSLSDDKSRLQGHLNNSSTTSSITVKKKFNFGTCLHTAWAWPITHTNIFFLYLDTTLSHSDFGSPPPPYSAKNGKKCFLICYAFNPPYELGFQAVQKLLLKSVVKRIGQLR